MKSHEYDFEPVDLGRALAWFAVPMLAFAVVIHIGAFSRLLPFPWPALDVDRTILTHQAQASRTPSEADILLIGDSSCLMDVPARKLEVLLPGKHRILNLGTLMYVGLNGYAAILSRYANVNPERVRTVIILLHPEMLRGVEPQARYLVFFSNYYAGADLSELPSFGGIMRGFFGLHIFRDRFLGRAPLALKEAYGRFYGFNLDLYRFMDEQGGSAADPHQYVFAPGQGNADYRLAPSMEPGFMALKAAVPRGTKLILGLTPSPESFAPAKYAAHRNKLLAQCGEWLRADAVLTNLPATMADADFASTTHLNQSGGLRYAEALAECLRPHVGH